MTIDRLVRGIAILMAAWWLFRRMRVNQAANLGVAELWAAMSGKSMAGGSEISKIAIDYAATVYGDIQFPKVLRGVRLVLSLLWVLAAYGFFAGVLKWVFFDQATHGIPATLRWLYGIALSGFVLEMILLLAFMPYARRLHIPLFSSERRKIALRQINLQPHIFGKIMNMVDGAHLPTWWLYGGGHKNWRERAALFARSTLLPMLAGMLVLLFTAHVYGTPLKFALAMDAGIAVIGLATLWMWLLNVVQKFSNWKGDALFPLVVLHEDLAAFRPTVRSPAKTTVRRASRATLSRRSTKGWHKKRDH
jgi:hypothetical protein